MNVFIKDCVINVNNQFEENKESEANLNLLKRKAPDEFGHTLLYFEE